MRSHVSLVVLALAVACQASAGTLDIVSLVSQSSYTNYLINDLYAQDGQGRFSGPFHDQAQTNIFNAFLATGLSPTLGTFTYGGNSYNNVIAVLPGTVNPNNFFIVSGHYDSVSGAPGADDDGSGVAGMLEAARVLSQFQFADSLVFVAFDREEEGLVGSAAYAGLHAVYNILGEISLDMIAYNSATDHNQAFIYGASTSAVFRNTLVNAVNTYSGGLTGVDAGTSLDCCSDQRSFENYGFPGALLIEHDPQSNPNYHQATDSLNTQGYIDYLYATAMTRAAVGFLADSAQQVPEPGTWLAVGTGLTILLLKRRVRP